MLWEHEPQASVSTAFSSSPKLSRVLYNSIETQSTCFLFLLENTTRRKRKQLVNFDYQNVNSFACAITTSTACASSVSACLLSFFKTFCLSFMLAHIRVFVKN